MIVNFRPKGVPVVFTRQERKKLLDDSIAVPPEILRQLEAAPCEGDRVRVWLDLDNLEHLVNGVAADANHAKTKRQERFFDGLYARLVEAFDRACGSDGKPGNGHAVENLAEGLMDLMAQAGTDAPDWIKEAMARRIDRKNISRLPELGDLSPEQAFFLNHSGWWAEPFPMRLASDLPFERVNESVFLRNARTLLQAADEAKGAPATAKGNLSRAFVARMLDVFELPPGELDAIRRYNKVVNEHDVWELHLARVICQGGGLLRKAKKRFAVTRKAKGMLGEDRAGALYGHLFEATFRKFNLSYLSRLPDAPGVQATAPYALYRIGRLPAGKVYEIDELVDVVFLPAVLEEIAAVSDYPEAPRWLLEGCLFRPLDRLGLVEILPEEGKTHAKSLRHRVRKLPLFDAFLRFDP